jgi:hypothetical protein
MGQEKGKGWEKDIANCKLKIAKFKMKEKGTSKQEQRAVSMGHRT